MATALPTPDSPDAPKYWKDETSGVLAIAIRSYLENPDGMTLREIADMRLYLKQWIASPVWDLNPSHHDSSRAALAALRQTVGRISNGRDIRNWLYDAQMEGIDPL